MESSKDLLRKYADIVKEAESQPDGFADQEEFNPEDFNAPSDDEQTPEENVPDESLMGDDSGITDMNQLEDPIESLSQELSDGDDRELDNIKHKISKWLKDNRYELTPIGGLSNKQGNV